MFQALKKRLQKLDQITSLQLDSSAAQGRSNQFLLLITHISIRSQNMMGRKCPYFYTMIVHAYLLHVTSGAAQTEECISITSAEEVLSVLTDMDMTSLQMLRLIKN